MIETREKLLQMLFAEAVAAWRPSQKTKLNKAKFLVDDSVRISNITTSFKKGYKQKYSNEVFKITTVWRQKSTCSDPVSYRLQGLVAAKFRVDFTIKNWWRSGILFLSNDAG